MPLFLRASKSFAPSYVLNTDAGMVAGGTLRVFVADGETARVALVP